MAPLIIALLAVVCLGAAGFALVPGVLGGGRANKRLKLLQGDLQANRRQNQVQRTRDDRRKSVQQVLKTQNVALQQKKRVALPQRLFQAGMKIGVRGYVRNCLILGAVVFLVLWLVQIPLLYAFIFAVAIGYLGPRFYVSRRTKSYRNRFLDELPNAVEAIVRGVKSGLPLNDSIRVVAREVKEPVRSEFARVLDQQSVGKSMSEAVPILFERVPLPEVNFFVVVITVQQQAGGNLSEALGNLSRVLRNRKKMKAKVKAISSEAKASAMIIGSLPFVVSGLVSLVTPGYLSPLWTTDVGLICLGVSAMMMSFGIFVMRRMIQFDF